MRFDSQTEAIWITDVPDEGLCGVHSMLLQSMFLYCQKDRLGNAVDKALYGIFDELKDCKKESDWNIWSLPISKGSGITFNHIWSKYDGMTDNYQDITATLERYDEILSALAPFPKLYENLLAYKSDSEGNRPGLAGAIKQLVGLKLFLENIPQHRLFSSLEEKLGKDNLKQYGLAILKFYHDFYSGQQNDKKIVRPASSALLDLDGYMLLTQGFLEHMTNEQTVETIRIMGVPLQRCDEIGLPNPNFANLKRAVDEYAASDKAKPLSVSSIYWANETDTASFLACLFPDQQSPYHNQFFEKLGTPSLQIDTNDSSGMSRCVFVGKESVSHAAVISSESESHIANINESLFPVAFTNESGMVSVNVESIDGFALDGSIIGLYLHCVPAGYSHSADMAQTFTSLGNSTNSANHYVVYSVAPQDSCEPSTALELLYPEIAKAFVDNQETASVASVDPAVLPKDHMRSGDYTPRETVFLATSIESSEIRRLTAIIDADEVAVESYLAQVNRSPDELRSRGYNDTLVQRLQTLKHEYKDITRDLDQVKQALENLNNLQNQTQAVTQIHLRLKTWCAAIQDVTDEKKQTQKRSPN